MDYFSNLWRAPGMMKTYRLKELLDDEKVWFCTSTDQRVRPAHSAQGLTEIFAVSADVLTSRQKEALRRVAQHFEVVTTSVSTDVSTAQLTTTVSEQRARPSKALKRSGSANGDAPAPKRPAARNPWGRILRLQHLELPLLWQEHIQQHGVDTGTFLTDPSFLRHKFENNGRSNAGDAFLASYLYARELEQRRTKDSSRWHFTMLLFYDIVRLIRPGASGRVGPLMKHEIAVFLTSLMDSNKMGPPTIDVDVVLGQLNGWSLHGSKLNCFCERFGHGSLFILEEHLSPDFLSTKFTMSGAYFKAAFEHLDTLCLREIGEDSGANALGAGIRDALLSPFQAGFSQ